MEKRNEQTRFLSFVVKKKFDPRIFQILSLSVFLFLGLFFFDFDTTWEKVAVSLIGCFLAQDFINRLEGKKNSLTTLASCAITALSLALLLRTNYWFVTLGLGILAILSKKLFVYSSHEGKKHLFNPANFSIVVGLVSGLAWVSPGQWGQMLWAVGLFFVFGGLTMWKALRFDIGLTFLFVFASLVIGRALFVGDPMSIPLHRLASGSIMLFAFHMITDPRSTPNHPVARILFASVTAILAWWGQTFWFIQNFVFYALFCVSLSTYVLDLIFKANVFLWNQNSKTYVC